VLKSSQFTSKIFSPLYNKRFCWGVKFEAAMPMATKRPLQEAL